MVFTQEELNKWNIEALRKYLSVRGVPLSGGGGRKADLIQKILAAQLLQLPVLPSLEEKSKEIQDRRHAKLSVSCIKIPYPEELMLGWMREYVYFPDITTACIKEYATKSISEKGYREGHNLMLADHVTNVEFNNISSCLKFCFIRGEVTPQTRIGETPYKVWICVNHDSLEILTGECCCIAGYSESCKHVFALLHFIEHKVALGLNKTCTSKKQKWQETVVKKKKEKLHRPVRLNLVNFKRPHPENNDLATKTPRNLFDPRSPQDQESSIDWNKLAVASDGQASVLCFKNAANVVSDHSYNQSTSPKLNPLKMKEMVYLVSSPNLLTTLLIESRTAEQISKIEDLTKGQSSNSLWFDYRYGVITASVAHDVLAKYKILKPDILSITRLVARILGYTPPPKTAALSWGIEHEDYARKRYIRQNKNLHKNFLCTEAGLRIHSEKFMLGASADGVITCSCCGLGNLEIKCPFSARDKTILEYAKQDNSCLKVIMDTVTSQPSYLLKAGHRYFTQVQHQMYVTGAFYADFVIYLPQESCTVRVKRDEKYGETSAPKLENFFNTYIVPEMFNKDIVIEYICKEVMHNIVDEISRKADTKHIQQELDQLLSS